MRPIASCVTLILLVGFVTACASPPATSTPATTRPATTVAGATPASTSAERISAREAVALAFAALPDDWKSTAQLAFVGRYSRYCNQACSPLVVEDDPGIGSDGRQAHWVVIFARDASATPAQLFYVENGEARLVAPDLAIIRPSELFPLEGWVDSTAIQFQKAQPAGLELRTGAFFEGADSDLAGYALLWLAETSFGRFDVYDATTGQYIKSR